MTSQAFKGKIMVIATAITIAISTTTQAQGTLVAGQPARGQVSAGDAQSWAFEAREGEVLSLVVEAAPGEALDPMLRVTNSTGEVLLSNDDYNPATTHGAALQAITIPRAGTYTATVTAYGNTAGEYIVTMLPGYGTLVATDDLQSWNASDEAITAETGADGLMLALEGINARGHAGNTSAPLNAFTQINIAGISGEGGWDVGLTLRGRPGGDGYSVLINDQGAWQFAVTTRGETSVVRDWTNHPAIRAGESAFTLGVLANGGSFQVFYNRQFVGEVLDTTISEAGDVGAALGTADAFGAQVRATFSNLIITTPLEGLVLAQQVTLGTAQATVRELQRRGVIPPEGEMVLVLDESTARDVQAGVSLFPLARTSTFTHLAMGAWVSITTSAEGIPAGCGLWVSGTDDAHYALAYLDQMGNYELSLRDGDAFTPGVFGHESAYIGDEHHLLLVLRGDSLHYYIDGQHVGTQRSDAAEGGVGNAVVNYEATDTLCTFRDTWVWRWDE